MLLLSVALHRDFPFIFIFEIHILASTERFKPLHVVTGNWQRQKFDRREEIVQCETFKAEYPMIILMVGGPYCCSATAWGLLPRYFFV